MFGHVIASLFSFNLILRNFVIKNKKKSMKNKENRNYAVFQRVRDALGAHTQKEVAERLEMRAASVSEYTRNGWPKKRLQQVADLTGVDIVWLEYGIEHPSPPIIPLDRDWDSGDEEGPAERGKSNLDKGIRDEIRHLIRDEVKREVAAVIKETSAIKDNPIISAVIKTLVDNDLISEEDFKIAIADQYLKEKDIAF